MATTKRLSKLQRLRYMNPSNYLDGTLCFWLSDSRNKKPYEDSLNEWLKDLKLVKEDLR